MDNENRTFLSLWAAAGEVPGELMVFLGACVKRELKQII